MDKETKKIGGLLTSFFCLLIVLQISTILFNLYMLSNYDGGVITFLKSREMMLSLVEIIAIILIFKWKKVGVYLLIFQFLYVMVVSSTLLTKLSLFSILNMIVYLIVAWIFYYLIRPIWNYLQ